MTDLLLIAIEGAVDRFYGRPRGVNPYDFTFGRACWEAWLLGWDEADFLLDVQGREEAARWLPEPAA
jgi:hypothetical protein